ncbi:MAG: outer membrane protein assembly factor BamA [Candidatus Zhuqueibacterota bacterium]
MVNSRSINRLLLLASALAAFLTPAFASGQGKYKVNDIQFIGNAAYQAGSLKKIMLTRKHSWLNRDFFQRNLFLDDLNVILSFYHNEGFLEAAIKNYQIKIDSLKNQVDLKIEINEGAITTIAGISFFGNHVFSDPVLFRAITSGINKPFKKQMLEKDNYNLLILYANQGYIEADIRPSLKASPEKHEILIDFNISEGPQVKIGAIKINGLKKTRPHVILRELVFKTGDIYHYEKILRSQRQLYLTGLFQSIFIKPMEKSPGAPGVRDIQIEVTEKQNAELNFGLGWGTLDKWRGSGELLQNNLMGRAQQVGLATFASFITRRVEASFTDPWLFSTRTKTDFNGFVERREEPGYNINRHGIRLTFGRKLGHFSNLSLAYRYEIVDVDLNDLSQPLKENEKGSTRSLIFTVTRDSRDDMINTTRGSLSSLDIESAGAFLQGTSTFIKLTGRRRQFIPITSRFVIASAVSWGWMGNYGVSKTVPIQERFFNGGANSVRGFKEKFLGPKNEDDNPIGGNIFLTLNLIELRYLVIKKFSFIAFADVGNVWPNRSFLSPVELRGGAGLGLRYHSPLGILRVDYSRKFDRQPGESAGEFYFSVGQAF